MSQALREARGHESSLHTGTTVFGGARFAVCTMDIARLVPDIPVVVFMPRVLEAGRFRGARAMTDRMRCAVVGIGHRAGTWIGGIVKPHAGTAELVALCDPVEQRCRDANGTILSYSLNCAVPFEGWNLAINGTGGRLETGITDGKPQPGWQDHFKIMKGDSRLRDEDVQIAAWPVEYKVHVMPHESAAYQVAVPNVAEGHGGGDPAIMRSFFVGREGEDDPLGLFAPAIQGAWCMAVGAAANISAAEGRVVHMPEVLGRWGGGGEA